VTPTAFTGLAALQSGIWQPGESYDDTGQYCLAAKICLHNAGGAAYGVLNMVKAIQVSDDVFFYNLGALLNANPVTHPNGGPLQLWARGFGIGRRTGIDLPGEVSGTLPSHDNAAIGQGGDQVTSLQLAVAYGALANGGTIVTPHVGASIQSADGATIQAIAPAAKRHLNVKPAYRETILEGLRDAASRPGGTSSDVMGSFPEQLYGTVGTAQYIANGHESDDGWYAGFVPATATSKPVVVAVTVEKGGFGDVAAAPVARQLLSQWFFGKPGPYRAGSSASS
jgi:penicillin-binding protein 2